MKKLLLLLVAILIFAGCDNSADDVDRKKQETVQAEATRQLGMPNIVNFQEKRNLKMILELRDNSELVTYCYIFVEYSGKFVFLGKSIGYPLPYSTQYTNPQKCDRSVSSEIVLPQADPNGLFSPSSANATWIMLAPPGTKEATPAYVEPNVVCLQTKLPDSMVINAGEQK